MPESQLKMTERKEKGIADVRLFMVTICQGLVWFKASSVPSSPRVGLELIKEIDKCKIQNQAVSQVAMKKILRYVWYLSEELIALAFFDDKVSNDTERLIVNGLRTSGSQHHLKRITVDPSLVNSRNLEDFVRESSMQILQHHCLPSTFFNKDLKFRFADADYQLAKNFVNSTTVVNDIAERRVALID